MNRLFASFGPMSGYAVYTVLLTASVGLPIDNLAFSAEGTLCLMEADIEGPFVRSPTQQEISSLVDSLKHSDRRNRIRTIVRLSAGGRRAIAALPTLLDFVRSPDVETRIVVASALANIAPEDPRVATALTDLLDDDDERVEAAAVVGLGKIGEAAKPALAALLRKVTSGYHKIDEEGTAEKLAIETFGEIGPGAKEAVPLLARVLADSTKTWDIRCDAADSLGRIGRPAVTAVPALMNVLAKKPHRLNDKPFAGMVFSGRTVGDSTVDIRFSAARALGRIGPAADASVPALIQALSDPASIPVWETIEDDDATLIIKVHWTVRAAAAKSLGKIGEAAKPAVPELRKLFDKDVRHITSEIDVEQLCFAGSIVLLDETADDARHLVVSGLGSPDPYIRGEAATLLGEISAANEGIIAKLLSVAKADESRHVRNCARSALRVMQRSQERVETGNQSGGESDDGREQENEEHHGEQP